MMYQAQNILTENTGEKAEKGQKILIVDDVEKNVQLLGKTLREKGYRVAFSLSGKQALELAGRNHFDLVLLDIMMPGMDGYEVCNRLRKMEGYAQVPIIFLTAKAQKEHLVRGFEAGANDYITKPFNAPELLARVQAHAGLRMKNMELKDKADKITRLSSEIFHLNEKLNKQNIALRQKNNELNESLSYAQHVQTAMLPSPATVRQMLPGSFLLFMPRDTISGDFYWTHQSGHHTVLAIADCTGHGISGGLLSVLGLSMLHRLVEHDGNYRPGQVLANMNQELSKLMRKKANINKSSNGMDIGLLHYDHKKNVLTYSGANISLLIIRNGELSRMKGDKRSINTDVPGPSDERFTEQNIEVGPGMSFYLTTDGFASQFGGSGNKKFNMRRLIELLKNNAGKTMSEQKKQLKTALEKWKNGREQTDDILVAGFKLRKT